MAIFHQAVSLDPYAFYQGPEGSCSYERSVPPYGRSVRPPLYSILRLLLLHPAWEEVPALLTFHRRIPLREKFENRLCCGPLREGVDRSRRRPIGRHPPYRHTSLHLAFLNPTHKKMTVNTISTTQPNANIPGDIWASPAMCWASWAA